MRLGSRPLLTIWLATFLAGSLLMSCGIIEEPPRAAGGPVAMRRLTADQYRRAIVDTFGPDIEIAGRFEPENRRDGLIAIGSAWVTVTPSGFEQYEAIGRDIARQVVSPAHRERLVSCRPADQNAPDADCSEAFLRSIGPRLLRRPLHDSDVTNRLALAASATEQTKDFYAGLEALVTSLLIAPDFLFRVEEVRVEEVQVAGVRLKEIRDSEVRAEEIRVEETPPVSRDPYVLRITDVTLASRLSYLLWNAGPDEALLEAASRGELSRPEVLEAQLDRMLASPRLEDGVRALFEDIFRFDEFAEISKDPMRYPVYSSKVAEDAREQTLRVLVDHLVDREGDYRDLFITRRTFMTRRLGPVYKVPVQAESGWEEMEFPAEDPRAGILAHASFNMLHAHPGRSSATLRGLFVREALLCQEVPPAPADVDFGLFNADDSPEHRTARDRLSAHASSASCRNCHALTDPIGLAFEVFDGAGRYRTTENEAAIDPSGDFDGRTFDDHVGLGEALQESPLVGACLVENVYRYAVGREPARSERRQLRYLEGRLEDGRYRLAALLRAVATSEGFRTATRPQVAPVVSETPSPRTAPRGDKKETT